MIRTAQVFLVVAAGGLWAASRLPWVIIRSFDGLGPPTATTVSGAVWSAALRPLALLLLAAVLAALAVRGWPLRVLAGMVALTSLAAGYLGISLWVISDVAARGADLAHVPLLALVGSERRYPGAAITLAAALCMLVGAVLLMRSAALSGGAAKYAAPAARRSARQSDADTAMSERMIWDALDAGRDPTDPVDKPAAPPGAAPGTECDTEGR